MVILPGYGTSSCARLGGDFPSLTSMVFHPEKEGSTLLTRLGGQSNRQWPESGRVKGRPRLVSFLLDETSCLYQAAVPKALLLTHWIVSAIMLSFSWLRGGN